MTRTYPVGYSANPPRYTADQLRAQKSFRLLHPEVQRRFFEMADTSQDEGYDLGFGNGWRDPLANLREWYVRYSPIGNPPAKDRPKGAKFWDGVWHGPAGSVKLADGRILFVHEGVQVEPAQWWAHVARGPFGTPGGGSYHEPIPFFDANGTLLGYWAVAIDFVNWQRDHWLRNNCHRFGFYNLAGVGDEPHCQPAELPHSRRDYRPDIHKLVLPSQEDDMRLIVAYDMIDGKRVNDFAIIAVAGFDAEWISDGHEDAAARADVGEPKYVPRLALKRYWCPPVLPPPGYGGRTKASDFKKRPGM